MRIEWNASARRWMALWVLLNLMACQSETKTKVTEPARPSLFLELKSMKGEAVSAATVQLTSGQSARPDASGQLLLEKLQTGLQLLQVRAAGFAPSLVAFQMEEDVQAGVRLKLLPLGEPITFNASLGLSNKKWGDLQLNIPPGALFNEQGQPIQGEVEVLLATLDLESDDLLAAPGLMEGITHPGAEPVGLESLGMVVLIIQQQGRMIPFARRIGVRGRVIRSVRLGSLSMVPTWRLDQEGGRWTPTGDTGHIVESAEKPGTYEWEVTMDNPSPVFNVALPYWWRSESAHADNPLQPPEPWWVETTCLAVRVEDEQGQPVAGRMVVARGVEYTGVRQEMTDGNGRVLLEVLRAQEVRVEAGGESVRVSVSSSAGTCDGQGAPAQEVTLRVPVRACTPGAARDCPYGGPPGTLDQGVCRAARQYCDANGEQWSDSCQGEVLPQRERCDNALDDDCDGAVNETCASVCEEGAVRSCYEGPTGSEGMGLCRSGTQTCVAGGTAWSACEGQVLPRAENCSTQEDEDCDGVACLCWPGQQEKCEYGGRAGTEGVGACQAGTRTCNDSGTAWGACTGEVTPQPEEDCTTPVDDDCDGEVNEGSVCACVPNSTQSCYSGPEGTQAVGMCQAGTQQCNASGTAWGACTGEVTPQVEICANGTDEDCDGRIDNPTSCGWVAANSMTSPRSKHSAVLMSNGKVLITGGHTGNTYTNTSEVYDPATNTWSPTGNMTSTRIGHTATLLGNGKVLVTGGHTGNTYTNTSEVYDPAINTWSPTGNMTSARSKHSAVLMSNGKVLITGGHTGNTYTNTSEVYDPATNTWSPTGNMTSARYDHTATLLGNGKVLVTGGHTGNTSTNTSEVYDPATNTWSPTGNMTSARSGHTATLLGNGKVLVLGGFTGSTNTSTAEVYDPANRTWSPINRMAMARFEHSATLLGNGKLLVVGGRNGNGTLDAAEIYDPGSITNTWSSAPAMTSARHEHTATRLSDGTVLVTGGFTGSAPLKAAELYDPATDTWSSGDDMGTARTRHTATRLGNGQVLVVGGFDGNENHGFNTAEVYDPATKRWSSGGTMASNRRRHTATLLSDGTVLVVGGWSSTNGDLYGYLKAAEVYDPIHNTWSSGGTMASTRTRHAATLLGNGKVLVSGGYNNSSTHNEAEVYDPTNKSWESVRPMAKPRHAHTLTRLSDGRVLAVGGGPFNEAEVYNPTDNTWSSGGTMASPRFGHTATLLDNGKVLVLGGYDGSPDNNNSSPLASAEVYDPGTNTWSSLTPMTTSRYLHTATPLGDGRVLVLGGSNGSGTLNTAEVLGSK